MTKINNKTNRKRERNSLYDQERRSVSLLDSRDAQEQVSSISKPSTPPEVKTIQRRKTQQEETINLRQKISEINPSVETPEAKQNASIASRIKKIDFGKSNTASDSEDASSKLDPGKAISALKAAKDAVGAKAAAGVAAVESKAAEQRAAEQKAAEQKAAEQKTAQKTSDNAATPASGSRPRARMINMYSTQDLRAAVAAAHNHPRTRKVDLNNTTRIKPLTLPVEFNKPEPPKKSGSFFDSFRSSKAEKKEAKQASIRPDDKPESRINKAAVAIIIVVACLVVAYFAGTFIWKGKFLPNTYINAQSVSGKTPENTRTTLLPQDTDYIITELNGEEHIPLSSINYSITFETPVEDLQAQQNRFLWPLALFGKTEFNNAVNISYDKNLLDEQLKSLDAFNEDLIINPEDAHIGRGQDGHFTIIPEIMGTRLDYDRTLSLIEDSMDGGNYAIDLTKTDCYLKPEIYKDNPELADKLKLVRVINEETITIDLTGAEEVLEPDDIVDFLIFDNNNNFTINEEYLTNYISELAKEYNTYLTERDFRNHAGNIIKVGGNHTETSGIDTYGFLMNQEQTKEILRECILSMQDQQMEAVWDVPANTRNDVNGDIGDTYIEISLTEQHLWQYIDGVLIFDTDVVTGLDTDMRRTPWGVFRAYDKAQNATLKGEMAGERWNTKVGFWISVTWTAVGIHDAVWQPGFGGDLYKTIGSHGCINVSLDAAEIIYNNVEIGTPIVIYY